MYFEVWRYVQSYYMYVCIQPVQSSPSHAVEREPPISEPSHAVRTQANDPFPSMPCSAVIANWHLMK
jgi:hypothetical protein